MQNQLIQVSKKEWEGMKQTIEILQNPDVLKQILQSEQNIKEGNVKELKI